MAQPGCEKTFCANWKEFEDTIARMDALYQPFAESMREVERMRQKMQSAYCVMRRAERPRKEKPSCPPAAGAEEVRHAAKPEKQEEQGESDEEGCCDEGDANPVLAQMMHMYMAANVAANVAAKTM